MKVKLTNFPVVCVTKENQEYLHCVWLKKLENLVAINWMEKTVGNRFEEKGRSLVLDMLSLKHLGQPSR